MKIENASSMPQVYFGLHMAPGIAEYQESGNDSFTILINENTIKNMDPSFMGKPVYVHHVDEVNLKDLQKDADGYVVESFYNKLDGKHWAKFIVVSDKGHDAIRMGWKLSNAYIPKQYAPGGLWHGAKYNKEVMSGEYEHLAIVPNPRYEESIVLTPEEFKAYNEKKELEIKKLSNSKPKENKSMLNFFKKSKVENADDYATTSVTLPKSGVEKTIAQLVNEMDEMESKKEEKQYANDEHMVKLGDKEMKVSELKDCYHTMKDALEPKKEESKDDGTDEKKEPVMANDEEKEPKMANDEAAEPDMENKMKKNAHFDAIKNAEALALSQAPIVDLSCDKLARGKARYGK